MAYFTTLLSSVGTSVAANLSWLSGRITTAIITSSAATSSGDFIVQVSLDDAQRIASSLATWVGLSSNSMIQQSLPVIHYSASSVFPSGSSTLNECVYVPIPGPIAGIRLSSSSLASGTTIKLQVLQGEAW
jgi:hypothetical protein